MDTGHQCPVGSHLPGVVRLLARTGVQGVVRVIGCVADCGLHPMQLDGIRLLPEGTHPGESTRPDGIWLTSRRCCTGEDLASLIGRVRPGGGIIITEDSPTGETFHFLSEIAGQVQIVHRSPHLVLALRKVERDEERLRRLARRYSPRGWQRAVKRVADVVLAGAGLVLTAPLMIAIAVVIRLTSPGPALMRQVRVKKGGDLFTFYKFRTMPIEAKLDHASMYAYDYSAEDLEARPFKTPDDPRNTPFGRAIRRVSLDELPNLINCIRGDISLVGPRPELPELIRYYRDEEQAILAVKPGVTGLAQVSGRDRLSIRQQQRVDLDYVRNWSLWLDLRILLRTACSVIGAADAY